MSREHTVDEIVTNFFLNTCRLCPLLTKHAVQAAKLCAETATKHHADDPEADIIPLITGSVAEFYIEPMLPLVNDIDVMHHSSTVLAIPRGHPPSPTQLPAEFSNYVEVFEIVDSHLPGYVYLELRYLLIKCIDEGIYRHLTYKNIRYLTRRRASNNLKHGPAMSTEPNSRGLRYLSVDSVVCVRCLSWPPQAADWPTRHRNNSWPDSATVDHVIRNVCDVVQVAHPLCRQDKWMSKHQWRLSFSRAEIVLLNSWMPVQQIVYHMLRFFVKAELLTDSDASEALSNYHIKTLMMWACELKSGSFWTEDLNLIKICVELLHTLSVWLTDVRCPHYFITSCNLIHNMFVVELIASQLMSMDEVLLATWFVNNYIQKCSMLCPDSVSSLFSDISTNAKLQTAVSAIANWKLNNALDMWNVNHYSELCITVHVSKKTLTVRSCNYLMTELTKIDSHLSIYFNALAFLYVAQKISTIGFTDDLVDVLATITGLFISTHSHPSQCSSELSLSKATKLMKVVAHSSCSTVQLIQIELSKAYLHRALRCKDSDSESIYCLANVYLAVLYYTTGQYQMAIDHCKLVMRSQDHSQCSSHVVQGELLPKIDDDIDSVLGLVVFYQYVRAGALNQRQAQHVIVFTTELFAYYLNIRCLSVTQKSAKYEALQSVYYLCTKQLFIANLLAVKLVIRTYHHQPALCITTLGTSNLVQLLQQAAVERLTTYRQLVARNLESEMTIVTADFVALYAYKRGDYEECLQFCADSVHTLLYAVNMYFEGIFVVFIQLLDDDIVSLIALTLIVNPECMHWSNNFIISQLTLSLYLMTQCQLKLRHSATSLAQTLDYIEVAQIRQPAKMSLNQLTLKLTKQKILMHIVDRNDLCI